MPQILAVLSQHRWAINGCVVGLFLALVGNAGRCQTPPPQPAGGTPWRTLFDGKTLQGWKISAFGGEGDVYVEDGRLTLDFGSSLTGITYTGTELPRRNYELRLEAQRVEGTDFFCGLTFPVGDDCLTLILGGWGGSVVGLSSLDGADAARNETRRNMAFRRNQWYEIRVRVTEPKVQVWIDEQLVIDQSLANRKLSLRPEVELSKPLGIAAWETRAALRRIELRTLPAAGDN